MEGTGASSISTRVALVNMPFAAADMPSIQCGLLKALLLREHHSVDVHYLNLELAAEFGSEVYDALAHLPKSLLLGEWLFAVAAFGPRPNESEYQAACAPSLLQHSCLALGMDFEQLCDLRSNLFPSWIDRWADAIDWSRYRVVGFTSMFEQNTAALAMARAIKHRHPQVAIVLGGANVDGDMGKEWVRTMSFVDFAVSGEGDVTFPELIRQLAAGEPIDVSAVFARHNGEVAGAAGGARVANLDELPDPDLRGVFCHGGSPKSAAGDRRQAADPRRGDIPRLLVGPEAALAPLAASTEAASPFVRSPARKPSNSFVACPRDTRCSLARRSTCSRSRGLRRMAPSSTRFTLSKSSSVMKMSRAAMSSSVSCPNRRDTQAPRRMFDQRVPKARDPR